MSLPKALASGSHRIVGPDVTLSRITPHLASWGITRCADITGLDHIGIPVTCAIRPTARTVQVSNGKGLRAVDAKVSAMMEAIELHHAENPAVSFRRDSMADLARASEPFVPLADLPQFNRRLLLNNQSRVAWVEAHELVSGSRPWVAASAAYCMEHRSLYHWSSNGLASGNHLTEATVHALYEVIERHTMSQLVKGDKLNYALTDVVDLDSVSDADVASLVALVRQAGITLVLLRPRAALRVHTFMAVLCDGNPLGLGVRVDPGYGAHLSPAVAAIRAITEAAQGRLTMIHGAREDLPETTYLPESHVPLYRFFTSLEPRMRWPTLVNHAGDDLDDDYQAILAAAREAGFQSLYRVNMGSREESPEIAVVKVMIPGALASFPI